jgi:hypothetical protein
MSTTDTATIRCSGVDEPVTLDAGDWSLLRGLRERQLEAQA